jgi:ribosomal-protein-alanine N-acetyltransferase
LTLRPATVEDAPELARVDAQCFDRQWDAPIFAAECGREDAWVDVFEVEDQLVGYAVIRVVSDEAELHRIGVSPDRRRHGVGGDLLVIAIERARSAAATQLLLEIAEGNGAARRLYRRAGFEPVGRRPGYYSGSGEDAVIMRLGLEP